MRLDQGSLIFKPLNGECPSWETSLGQSHEGNGELPPYHFKAEGYENILKGLIFNSVPLNTLSCILGKTKEEVNADTSYQFTKTQEIQLAGKFDKVIVHFGGQEKSFVDAPFTLLLTKIQDGNKYHFGRRSIKYSPHTIADGVKNSDSFEKIQSRFGERLACYGLFVEHFDTLHLYCVSADTYYDKNNWKDFSLPETEWTDWVEWEKEVRKNIPPQVNQVPAPKPSKSFTPAQIIYYGVPGCGKSFNVDQDIDKKLKDYGITDKEYHKVRCVFHPEYCNADFVGQIYPYVKPNNEGVEYRFKPGPFAEVIRRAFRNPTEPFFLIIEEISRGNAAAIFGEMFQLLDRIKQGDVADNSTGNEYVEGWSSYGIENVDMNAYIRQKSTNNPETIEYDECVPYGDKIKLENYTSVRLPPNLSIYATMNTSDQNVIAMDNAFQRRFKSRMIRNKLSEEVFPGKAQYNIQIDGTGVCWGKFREWINSKILSPENGISKADDKCLGGWFISTSVKEKGENGIVTKFDDISREDFAEKVLKYLWDDVFKRNAANNIFNKDEFKSLSDLIDAFEEKTGESYILDGLGAFAKIFRLNDDDKNALTNG